MSTGYETTPGNEPIPPMEIEEEVLSETEIRKMAHDRQAMLSADAHKSDTLQAAADLAGEHLAAAENEAKDIEELRKHLAEDHEEDDGEPKVEVVM